MGVRRVTEGRLFKENGKRKPVTRTLWFSGFIVPNNSWEAYLLFAKIAVLFHIFQDLRPIVNPTNC